MISYESYDIRMRSYMIIYELISDTPDELYHI